METLTFRKCLLYLLGTLLLTTIISNCTILRKIRPEKEPIKKVIVTHAGEIKSDTKFVNDKITFKIYYKNTSKKRANIGIIDQLDSVLNEVVVFNGGIFDSSSHSISWLLINVEPGKSGFVYYEATINDVKNFNNKAYVFIDVTNLKNINPRDKINLVTARDLLNIPKKNAVETNTVDVIVHSHPKLGWVPFDTLHVAGQLPDSYLKDETTMDLMINFDIPGMYVNETKVDGVTFHQLSMPMHANLLNIGKPQVPIVGRIVEVPKNINFEVEIVQLKSLKLQYYNVFPAQEPPIRVTNENKNDKFAIDSTTYLSPNLFPKDISVIKPEDIGIIRGHRIVFLKINPVQFNPITKEITAYSKIEVKIKYNKPAQIQMVDTRIISPAFETLLRRTVMNYKDSRRFLIGSERPQKEVGCDYLILTHGDFYNPRDNNNPVVRFAEWKRQKGYDTKIVDIATITPGQTAENIKDYIKNAYDNWYPVPTYVLLIGDSDFINTHYKRLDGTDTSHPYTDYDNASMGTDLYYSTVDGSDHYPDIFLGRLSIDSLAEAEDVIDKILEYEKNPPTNPNYYVDNSLVSLFEDVSEFNPTSGIRGNGREDTTFRIVEFSEAIRTYLQNNTYNSNRIYDQSGTFANGPLRYEDGTNIPANLTIAGGFPWTGGTADIRNSINNGNFIVAYDGHGGRQSWSRPGFNNTNVNNLTNGNLTPVVLSFACNTGWFDNETDNDTLLSTNNLDTANNSECLCESFLRHNNGGAVAIIGASRVSYEENDFMLLGAFKAIWPDFSPNPPFQPGPLPDFSTSLLVRMGQVHTFCKIFMANAFSDYRLQFELYHLFGDPEMPVWTEEPSVFQVIHPAGIGSTGIQDFIVRVLDDSSNDPVNLAQITLTQGDLIIVTKQTNPDGYARFTLNNLPAQDIEITVTALNYRPYEGNIEVSTNGAHVNRLDPSDGIENQIIHIGGMDFSGNENIDIFFGATNVLTTAATGGSFGQVGSTDVTIQVPSPYDLGPVNILAKGQSSNRYGVDVFRVRTSNPIDLYTYSQWDNSTWHLYSNHNPTWNNPEIQLYDASNNNPVASNNLNVGHNYIIKVKIHNDTDFNADNTRVTIKWANFGVGQPDRVWYLIDTINIDNPRHTIQEAETTWAPGSTGHLCILAEIYHIEDINENNNKGQENCHVGPTSSPANVSFLVWNPTDKPAAVYLELRQLINIQQGSRNPIWGSAIVHPDPQMILPGESRKASVIINPDLADVKKGEKVEFSLTGYIKNEVIGGANFIIYKSQ